MGPLSLDIPGAEALVPGIIAGEMAMLDEAFFFVSTYAEVDLLEIAHIAAPNTSVTIDSKK